MYLTCKRETGALEITQNSRGFYGANNLSYQAFMSSSADLCSTLKNPLFSYVVSKILEPKMPAKKTFQGMERAKNHHGTIKTISF